jgi:hypothetical protein
LSVHGLYFSGGIGLLWVSALAGSGTEKDRVWERKAGRTRKGTGREPPKGPFRSSMGMRVRFMGKSNDGEHTFSAPRCQDFFRNGSSRESQPFLMKKLILPAALVLLAFELCSCVAPHPSPVVRGRRWGGVAGAAIGGAVGGWDGAAAGALIGGAAGGMTGRVRRSYYTGTPYYAPARSVRGMGYY